MHTFPTDIIMARCVQYFFVLFLLLSFNSSPETLVVFLSSSNPISCLIRRLSTSQLSTPHPYTHSNTTDAPFKSKVANQKNTVLLSYLPIITILSGRARERSNVSKKERKEKTRVKNENAADII